MRGRRRLAEAGLGGAIGLLTSRDVSAYTDTECARDGVSARCIATVGMGNALRAGDPPGPTARIGTINLLCRVSVPLGGLLAFLRCRFGGCLGSGG